MKINKISQQLQSPLLKKPAPKHNFITKIVGRLFQEDWKPSKDTSLTFTSISPTAIESSSTGSPSGQQQKTSKSVSNFSRDFFYTLARGTRRGGRVVRELIFLPFRVIGTVLDVAFSNHDTEGDVAFKKLKKKHGIFWTYTIKADKLKKIKLKDKPYNIWNQDSAPALNHRLNRYQKVRPDIIGKENRAVVISILGCQKELSDLKKQLPVGQQTCAKLQVELCRIFDCKNVYAYNSEAGFDFTGYQPKYPKYSELAHGLNDLLI